MPSRFPFLKSKRDPYGLVEQFGIAVTIDPANDGSENVAFSWFGTTLDKDAFVLNYTGDDGVKDSPISGHKTITEAYAKKDFSYTAYDWRLTSLSIDDTLAKGTVQGLVSIKGSCKLCDKHPTHDGLHRFQYDIIKGADGWLIKEWTLVKQKKPTGVVNPLVDFLREDI
jgi:hypothetical protein